MNIVELKRDSFIFSFNETKFFVLRFISVQHALHKGGSTNKLYFKFDLYWVSILLKTNLSISPFNGKIQTSLRG